MNTIQWKRIIIAGLVGPLVLLIIDLPLMYLTNVLYGLYYTNREEINYWLFILPQFTSIVYGVWVMRRIQYNRMRNGVVFLLIFFGAIYVVLGLFSVMGPFGYRLFWSSLFFVGIIPGVLIGISLSYKIPIKLPAMHITWRRNFLVLGFMVGLILGGIGYVSVFLPRVLLFVSILVYLCVPMVVAIFLQNIFSHLQTGIILFLSAVISYTVAGGMIELVNKNIKNRQVWQIIMIGIVLVMVAMLAYNVLFLLSLGG